jgi:hypothetical protein
MAVLNQNRKNRRNKKKKKTREVNDKMGQLAAEKQHCALTGAEKKGHDEENKKLSFFSWKSHNQELLE